MANTRKLSMNVINQIEEEQMKVNIPDFESGDTVRLQIKIIEGGKERIQQFEGIVIKRQGGGLRESFTVRKTSHGIGVERSFPLHSPNLQSIEVMRRGDVRRAKLYYLRERRGKASRIKEKRDKQV